MLFKWKGKERNKDVRALKEGLGTGFQIVDWLRHSSFHPDRIEVIRLMDGAMVKVSIEPELFLFGNVDLVVYSVLESFREQDATEAKKRRVRVMHEASGMKTPTEAQLNDPKWWDENAPEGAEIVWLVWNGAPRVSNLARVVWAKRGEGVVTATGQEAEYFHRPEASEPIADRIMELGNQVHNLGCEVQYDEALAGELEDIRARLWDLGGKVRKAQEREEILSKAEALDSGLQSTRELLSRLYDAGMLRKAGGQ